MAEINDAGGWEPGALGYVAELTALQTEVASVVLGLRQDGLIDMVVDAAGTGVVLLALSPKDLAEFARKVAAATSPDVIGAA